MSLSKAYSIVPPLANINGGNGGKIMLEVLLGQIPEAIYFALFLILTKKIKEKRILFVILMMLEYVLTFKAMPYSIYGRIGFFVISYITLKVLYKEKAQITDVFTLAIASIILIILSAIPSFLFLNNMGNMTIYIIYIILTRILIFGFLFIFRNKLCNIQLLYKKFWNRNDKAKLKMKSATFRSLSLVVFNIMFYVINIGLAFALFIRK